MKPRLPRQVTSSAKINLNKYWDKLEKYYLNETSRSSSIGNLNSFSTINNIENRSHYPSNSIGLNGNGSLMHNNNNNSNNSLNNTNKNIERTNSDYNNNSAETLVPKIPPNPNF